MKSHRIHYPDVKDQKIIKVNGITFDNFILKENISIRDYNILAIDVQGLELKVLKGSKQFLSQFELIMTEISREEVYEGCALIDEVTKYLKEHDYVLIDYFENKDKPNDDAYYIRSYKYAS
jgi:hypothetical protein